MTMPRLYSVSTVCLLKHYNQDYLLHELRTDFTGANGVGKSIIADLFQVVFVADSKYIKFATEGIDKKKRKIESLPYQSGIGYTFFNVEIEENKFVIIGAAILSQGNVNVKPFIITSSIDFTNKIEHNTFSSEKLLFCHHFLKTTGEAFTLDDLSRIAPDKFGLYVHSFETKDEKQKYYDWLYNNELLPINLTKESNLKSYAKVIQSFSKSKTLDIDNSQSLIEYLFEQDEEEIGQEYKHQEEDIQKLLHQLKVTQNNINDIASKQKDLSALKGLSECLKQVEHSLAMAEYNLSYKNRESKESAYKKVDTEIKTKGKRLNQLKAREDTILRIRNSTTKIAEKQNIAYSELVNRRAAFDRFEKIEKEENLLSSLDISSFMKAETEDATRLLKESAHFFYESISKSENFLLKYKDFKVVDQKKKEQDEWLLNKRLQLSEREKQLEEFKKVLTEVSDNSFFLNALSSTKNLSKSQQSALILLRNLYYGKPTNVTEGTRYTDDADLLKTINITPDNSNKGWWLEMGSVNEFIPEHSLLFPDLSKLSTINQKQLKDYIEKELDLIQDQKELYYDLEKGRMPTGFSEYQYDLELSDHTKISNHKLAAELCGLLDEKITILEHQKKKERDEIEKIKRDYEISIADTEYDSLIKKTGIRKEIFDKRAQRFKSLYSEEQSEIKSIIDNNSALQVNYDRSLLDFNSAKQEFEDKKDSFTNKYPSIDLPDSVFTGEFDIAQLNNEFSNLSSKYLSNYNQTISKYEESKERRSIAVNEQVDARMFSFDILEQCLLGKKIKTLDEVTGHLEGLNIELLSIADELLKSLVKVFGKTEHYYGRYKKLVEDLNDFFKGKLISNRFYFRIDFNPNPKLEIEWIEHLRKSVKGIASSEAHSEMTPEQFIEGFYQNYSGNRNKINVEHLLNPKSYFVLKGKLTDENGKDIPGSTGESYTAVSLLGIARLSVVQDGTRKGLRFLILEESATLDNVNFGIFPIIAEEYGYQIITMTPRPYAIGEDNGWYIHQLIPGTIDKDVNYPKVMSYFRTAKQRTDLEVYLKTKGK